jgi:hypothetical protein
MKTALAKSLKSEFDSKFREVFPQLDKLSNEFGGVVYLMQGRNDGYFIFVFLSPSPKFDRFTIEFAANSEARFPFELFPGDRDKAARRERIRTVYTGTSDGWWNLSDSHQPDLELVLKAQSDLEGAFNRVLPAVNKAVTSLRKALPDFLASLQ